MTNQKPVQGGRQAHPTHTHTRHVGGRSPHGSSESEQSEDGSQVREREKGTEKHIMTSPYFYTHSLHVSLLFWPQGTAQNDPNFVFVPRPEPMSHRLSVIPEQAENTLDRVDPVIMTTELDLRAQEDMHTETDLSQVGW